VRYNVAMAIIRKPSDEITAQPASTEASYVRAIMEAEKAAVDRTAQMITRPMQSMQPQPAVAVPVAPVPDEDLPSILRRLNPEQRAKLRSSAIAEGLIQSPSTGQGCRKNPDGSISLMIRVDSDLVPQLETWAESAGVPVEKQIQEMVGMLLNSYLLSPWQSPQPAPVVAGAK
jgi:hypothetical protein